MAWRGQQVVAAAPSPGINGGGGLNGRGGTSGGGGSAGVSGAGGTSGGGGGGGGDAGNEIPARTPAEGDAAAGPRLANSTSSSGAALWRCRAAVHVLASFEAALGGSCYELSLRIITYAAWQCCITRFVPGVWS